MPDPIEIRPGVTVEIIDKDTLEITTTKTREPEVKKKTDTRQDLVRRRARFVEHIAEIDLLLGMLG